MDYKKKKEELSKKFDDNVAEIQKLQAENLELRGQYKLIEELEKDEAKDSVA